MAIFNQLQANRGVQSQAAGIQEKISENFPSPWLDPASTKLPYDLEQVLQFCELLWYSNGVYQQALARTAAYFVTKVKVEGVGAEEQERWEDFLENDLGINKLLTAIGRNEVAYGNVMMSPRVVINRLLRCECGQLAPLQAWDGFRFTGGRFHTGPKGCKKCHKSTRLERLDYRSTHKHGLAVKIWNPHQIKLKYNEITDRAVYHYQLPANMSASLRRGDPDFMCDTPWEYIQCALDRKPLRIFQDRLFHLRDEPLAGIRTSGVGLPRAMANFRQAYLTQAYKRMNMVLALEYSVPLRSVTPQAVGIERVDPTMGLDMADISNKLGALLADWKRDPAAMHFFPIPLQYTAWGGEGLQMAGYQLQDQAMHELLAGLGVPVDFFLGTFKSERTFVPVLRLMERTWEELVYGYKAALDWIAEILADLLRWKKPMLKLEPTTTADNEERRQLLLELWMNNRVSGKVALEPLGLNPVEEMKELVKEEVESQREADKARLEMEEEVTGIQAIHAAPEEQVAAQQAAAAGGAPAGVAPTGAGVGMGQGVMQNALVRPDDILAEASRVAQELLAMPEGQRHQPLSELRRQSDVLHAAVIKEMDRLRDQVQQPQQA